MKKLQENKKNFDKQNKASRVQSEENEKSEALQTPSNLARPILKWPPYWNNFWEHNAWTATVVLQIVQHGWPRAVATTCNVIFNIFIVWLYDYV